MNVLRSHDGHLIIVYQNRVWSDHSKNCKREESRPRLAIQTTLPVKGTQVDQALERVALDLLRRPHAGTKTSKATNVLTTPGRLDIHCLVWFLTVITGRHISSVNTSCEIRNLHCTKEQAACDSLASSYTDVFFDSSLLKCCSLKLTSSNLGRSCRIRPFRPR